FGFGAAVAGLVQPGQAVARIAPPPLRGRSGGATNFAADRAAGHAIRRQQHDLRSLAHPIFRLIPNCGELDSSWPTSALERCAHISLDHCTFLQWMSRWNSRRMSQGLRVLVLVDRAKLKSSVRSSSVNLIGVASGMPFMHP